MKGPTEKQLEILRHIHAYTVEHGVAPTTRELTRMIGCRGNRAADDRLHWLARKGYVVRERSCARALFMTADGYREIGVSPPDLPSPAEATWFMRPRGLSNRQYDVLSYIVECRLPPTFREIVKHFGWNSTNGVHDHIVALVKKGWLLRRPGAVSRGIYLTDKARLTFGERQAPVPRPLDEPRKRTVVSQVAWLDSIGVAS